MSEKYTMFVGDAIKNVSVFVRKRDREYPIYANTRGECEWYTFTIDDYENVQQVGISLALKHWLAEFHARITGEGDTHRNSELPDLEWYETEFLNAIGEPVVTDEQFEMMEWAFNEARDDE